MSQVLSGIGSQVFSGFGELFKPQFLIDKERQAAAISRDAAAAALDAQLSQAMQQVMYDGNAAQAGWASTAQPHVDPINDIVRNPFQAAALYMRLRMTRDELKQKDIEIAFVRQMGGLVHVAIVNRERILTMIDEDVGAFPSDAFIARIRLLL